MQMALLEVEIAVGSDGELSASMHRVVELGDSMWPVLDAFKITTGRGVEGQHLVSTGSSKTSMGMHGASSHAMSGADTSMSSRRGALVSFDQQSTSTGGRGSVARGASASHSAQSTAVSALAFPALFCAARSVATAIRSPDKVSEHPRSDMLASIVPSGLQDKQAGAGEGGAAAADKPPVSSLLGGKRTRQERREQAKTSPIQAGTGMPPPQSSAGQAPDTGLKQLPFSLQVVLEPTPVPVGLAARASSATLLMRSFKVAEMLVGAASRAMQI